ncbi:rRNA-binding ribosome biosynthesis protein utp25 [Coniothyrium glycines]
MAPVRGRSASRGRRRGGAMARGRGGARGRGRGAGRGRGGFPVARTRDEVEDSHKHVQRSAAPHDTASEVSANSDSYSSDDDDDNDNDDGDAEDEDAQPALNAYASLLRSLSSNVNPGSERLASAYQPRHKKRKLRHDVPDDVDYPREIRQASDNNQQHNGGNEDEEHQSEPESPEGSVILSLSHNKIDQDDSPDEDDEHDEPNDVFQRHFANPDEEDLTLRLERVRDNDWSTKKIADGGGRGVLQVPSSEDEAFSRLKIKNTSNIDLKMRLASNAHQLLGDFNHLEQAVAPSIFGYQDLLFAARTTQNAGRFRDMICLHALNHILKTRDRVIKNNAKLAAATEDDDAEYRDQGFTRPKILFLLETKQACVRILESITKLHDFEQQENKKRFLDSFSQPEDKFSDDKPADFRELFEGNDENEFRVGVKLARKTLKLFSTFYNSDIIFASTLGLRRAIESGDPKKRDFDFLSSIEMVVMEQADAALMQNWEHAEFVFEHLNLQPRDAHGCDFSRVRSWYLDGHAANLRQTIVLSAYLTPKINTLYNKHMRNIAGRLKYSSDYTAGLIESSSYGMKQTFYFNSSVLPFIKRLPQVPEGGPGVLVYIPSYLDFVRVRNSLVDTDLSYTSISEYTEPTDVRKARSHFMNGKYAMILYTGRAHHFHRYNIRGVKRVVFYGVPENPYFFDEVVGFIGKTLERGEISRAEAHVRVCFSKWERLELEKIVGTKRIGRMIADKGDVFDFL